MDEVILVENMNQSDQNKNKDMIESDLIDVESMDFEDQTWLYTVPEDSGQKLDIVDWSLSCDWPVYEDEEYIKTEKEICKLLEDLLKNAAPSVQDKHKFDSGTYIKPKKRVQRPSIQSIVEVPSNPPSLTSTPAIPGGNKYLTYNKYSMPLGPVSPMLRLKTFNVDTNSENSSIVKEYAMKRRSLVQDDDPQLEDADVTATNDVSERLSPRVLSKPINIDLSQPAHNLHNTFNRGISNLMNERNSLNMYQSGESLMRMSPPSLVSSMVMENSGSFHPDSNDGRKSLLSLRDKDSGLPASGRESIDPLMTSITLSILDEKDMSTSFLSQTTHPDNDSFMDSLPPSLVSSVNSSFVISNTSKPKGDKTETNVFSSPTYTHLEQSEKLLSARPRFQLYNNFKRDSGVNRSESYTKAKEEACQMDTTKVLNENCDNKDSSKIRNGPDMSETITLHFSSNKFKRTNDAEKENLNSTFEKDDAFFRNNDMHKTVDMGKNSLNVTLDKQELNEIIQARQKLSLARKGLPTDPDKPLPNQIQPSPTKIIHLPNQTITVPIQSMENASELLSRRKAMNANNSFERNEEHTRDTPKRNATFKKVSPKHNAMDTTIVYVKPEDTQIIDINSATLNLIDVDRTLQKEEWAEQERAMVGSNESTDTGTFSSSSPPDSVPDTTPAIPDSRKIASTPLMSLKKSSKDELLNLHSTISPIYDIIDDKSYIINKPAVHNTGKYDANNTTVINSTTIRRTVKRDILAPRSPEKKIPNANNTQRISPTNTGTQGIMVPPVGIPRKSGLPTSKLRQYSSHKELNRIPGPISALGRLPIGRPMERRSVYASNPVLSPTASNPPTAHAPPVRRDSYVLVDRNLREEKESGLKPSVPPTPALIRQGTETLRRERPHSQLVAPKDLRSAGVTAGSATPLSVRNHHMPPPTTRPYSIAGTSQLRVARPSTAPAPKHIPAPVDTVRPATGVDRVSALPRPSRLPAPRRQLRPPSVYSVAHTADVEHY